MLSVPGMPFKTGFDGPPTARIVWFMTRAPEHRALLDTRATALRDMLTIGGLFAALTLVYWIGVLAVCGQPGFPLDDAFIHMQFARHLVEDGQMAFNRGVPSSGSTAPLYAVLLAGIFLVVRNWYLASAILGGLAAGGTIWVVYVLVRDWTGRIELARTAALLTTVVSPTLISAYGGMETAPYVLFLFVGLWLYANPRLRLPASLVLASTVWLRPEFMMVLPCIAIERAVAAYRGRTRRLVSFLRDFLPHVVIWALVLAAYMGYHWHQDHHLLPTTFGAKAVALGGFVLPFEFGGLPAALHRGSVLRVLLALTVWPALLLLTVGIGQAINCAPLAFGVPQALRSMWRDDSGSASGRRLALLVFLAYPLARGLVDPIPYPYQFQRYYAHMSPLMVILCVLAWPATGTLVRRKGWDWSGLPLQIQLRRATAWALPALGFQLVRSFLAVSNINTMQVDMGQWLRAHAAADEFIAANDIGAIGFISERPILDTIGLIEPAVVAHYLRGGDLLSYLEQRRPGYVVIFPRLYPELSQRTDLLEPVHTIRLKLNVICGAAEMVAYRTRWRPPLQ